jgi:uncharacterized protein with HEPN domain
MVVSVADRLSHMKDSIVHIRELLDGRSVEQVVGDRVSRAALERFLEVLSEASRYVPDEWKAAFGPAIPWWEIAAFGNILRHEYDQIDLDVLWDVYARDLGPLEAVIDAMIAAHPPKNPSP